jgi:hypothetical protein
MGLHYLEKLTEEPGVSFQPAQQQLERNFEITIDLNRE